jgi:hypothetical protein
LTRYTDYQYLNRETRSTIEFFSTQSHRYHLRPHALFILRGVLVSLTTYHLPAETAVTSIGPDKQQQIEGEYNNLINSIDHLINLNTQNNPAAIIAGSEPDLINALLEEIIDWTDRLFLDECQKDHPERYVFQKSFVLLFHLGRIASKNNLGQLEDQSTILAARSIAKLEIDRLRLCEGMMLSFFINKNPFPDMNDTSVLTDIQLGLVQRVIQTIWGRFGAPNTRRRAAITAYMINLIKPSAPNGVPQHDPTESSLAKVHQGFIKGVIRFVGLAHGFEMRPDHCSQLLEWATRVWDWVFHSYNNPERDRIRTEFRLEMDGLILSISSAHRQAGRSTQN